MLSFSKLIRPMLALLLALFSFQNSFAQTLMPLPPHATVYSPTVRGYWFTAPVDFTIVGLRIPPEAGTGAQYMQVIRINDPVPVVFAANSTNFTSLAYINAAPNGVIQTVNIQVAAGDKIGIFGSADLNNSYGTVTGPTNIDGNPVTLARILYQGNIMTAGIPNYSTEPTSASISRVEMYYVTAVPCDDTLESAVVLGPKVICPNKQFSLAIGLQNGTLMSGLTYQWQYSVNSGLSWSNFTGVPNVAKGGQISDVITSDKWYRCIIRCTATNETFTTPVHKVSIAPFYYCYCDNETTVDNGANIGKVAIINTTNDDTVFNKGTIATGSGFPVYNNAQAARKYTGYHDSLAWPCLYRDSMYRFLITQIHPKATFQKSVAQVYIDYNRDGIYNPNTERVFVKDLDGTNTQPEIVQVAAKVPSTAAIGVTGMRVIISEKALTGAPCDTISGYGEVEDYIIQICHRPCDAPVKTGIVVSTDTSMCKGYEYTLTDTTYEKTVSSFTRAWQVSGDAITWFNINNSQGKDTLERVFTGQPLFYRLRTICVPTHDTAYSDPTEIKLKPGYKCYCYSKAVGGLGVDTSDIGGVTIGGYKFNSGGPHLLNPKAYYPRTDYTDIEPIPLYTDSMYRFTVYHTMPVAEHGDAKVTIFMDFNNNHKYDIPSERIYTGFTAIGNHTLIDNVVIPRNAILDVPTGMRVILNNNVGPNIPSDEACGPYESGETEDYILIFRRKIPEGVNEVNKLNGFNVHPNPTSGKFNIRFNTDVEISDVQVRITNVTGQVVFEQKYTHAGGTFNKELDMSNNAAGVYFVQLQADGAQLMTKLVVQ